jgi:hypothetical protein
MRRAPSLRSSPSVVVVLLLGAPQHSSVFALSSSGPPNVQSTATFTGKVVDQNDAVVSGAKVTARHTATGVERNTETDDRGAYQLAALPVGYYRLEISASGFRAKVVEQLEAEVAKIVVQDFQLEVGDVSQMVQVPADASLVELATISAVLLGAITVLSSPAGIEFKLLTSFEETEILDRVQRPAAVTRMTPLRICD